MGWFEIGIAQINAFDSDNKLVAKIPRSQINQKQTPKPFTPDGVIVDGRCHNDEHQ